MNIANETNIMTIEGSLIGQMRPSNCMSSAYETSLFRISKQKTYQNSQKKPTISSGFNGLAATYSPGDEPSTIGVAGLNFSVRNGKR